MGTSISRNGRYITGALWTPDYARNTIWDGITTSIIIVRVRGQALWQMSKKMSMGTSYTIHVLGFVPHRILSWSSEKPDGKHMHVSDGRRARITTGGEARRCVHLARHPRHHSNQGGNLLQTSVRIQEGYHSPGGKFPVVQTRMKSDVHSAKRLKGWPGR